MGGKVFLRLCEKDLEAEGLNLKWRKLMIEAVKKLRRDCLRGRIWGLEGGLQLPRQDDELEDEPDKGTKDGLKRSSINPMETLKRLRDKKAIKAMIDAFESGQDQGQEEEARSFTSSSRGHRSRGSLSSVHSSDSIEQLSGCAPLSPIYGKGFVKSLAESYTSLNDASPQNSRKDFTREELEHWFGSLSDQEAEALANELHQDEELQQCELEMHHSSGGTRSYSSRSSTSGESEVLVTPAVELKGFDLTPLDANIIEAILGERLETGSINEIQDNDLCVEPLHREDLIDDDTVMFERSQSLNQLRSELLKGAKMNLYRESTYETEDMVALGLLLKDDDDVKHNTARKLDCLLSKEAVPFKGPMDPSQDSMRMKKVSQDTVFAKDIFGSVSLPDKIETLDHMRHMTALEIRGLSPYKSVSPGMSRSSSQRKRGEGERTAVSEAKEGNTMATFGRRGGLANKLQGGESFDECAANKSDDGGKAEDESEWGVTVSRKASRRSTLARATNRDTDKAAARMADLFTPAASIQAELNEVNLKELEAASSSKEHLCVPMTTGELSEDGKSVKRKRSMVLVERKKFEALARRMGVLESQLAQLEAASLPSLSDLGSMSERGRNSHKLDEIFALPAVPQPSRHNVSEQQKGSDDGDGPLKVWSLPMMLSALPSYGEHLDTLFCLLHQFSLLI